MNARGHRTHFELVAPIDPGGGPNNLVNQKQQGNQDSVMTLVEMMSGPEFQVKSGQMPLAIGDTHRTEITKRTNPLRYPKE
jgi:hypothetical protein